MDKQNARLMEAMVSYDAGDTPRIQHFIKVHNFAATIAALEGVDEATAFTLEAAAILHDIGIHPSERLYGDCTGKHQEELGPTEARKLLAEVGGYTDAQVERICFLIAHHHTYTGVEGMDWQILLEADFLVNSFEDHLNAEAIRHFEQRIFKTATGKRLLAGQWGL